MPANEYTLYNSPLAVLRRLALPLSTCTTIAITLLLLPFDSIPSAFVVLGIIFLTAFLIPFLFTLIDRRPKLTLSPKGLFIHTKFSETPHNGTNKPRSRKKAFYAWHNLGYPSIEFMSAYLTIQANDMPELTEIVHTPLPDNATDEQVEATLAEMEQALADLDEQTEIINNAKYYSLSLPVFTLPHGKRLPKILQSLIDAENETERLAIIQKLQYKS